jgi:hypothetical protein
LSATGSKLFRRLAGFLIGGFAECFSDHSLQVAQTFHRASECGPRIGNEVQEDAASSIVKGEHTVVLYVDGPGPLMTLLKKKMQNRQNPHNKHF